MHIHRQPSYSSDTDVAEVLSLFTNKVSQTSALRLQAGGESPAVDDLNGNCSRELKPCEPAGGDG